MRVLFRILEVIAASLVFALAALDLVQHQLEIDMAAVLLNIGVTFGTVTAATLTLFSEFFTRGAEFFANLTGMNIDLLRLIALGIVIAIALKALLDVYTKSLNDYD